jgi:hypothetical protein
VLAANTNIAALLGSAGGWTNNSASTRTLLHTIVNSSNHTGSFIVQNQTGSMHLFVNGSSGFVGINKSNPVSALDVAGVINVSHQIVIGGMPGDATVGSIIGKYLNVYGETGTTWLLADKSYNGYMLNDPGAGKSVFGVLASNNDATGYLYAGYKGSSQTLKYFVTINGSEYLAEGLGIGTTAPTATLMVNSSNITGSLLIQNTTGSTHLFVNGSSGYVGVGTVIPGSALDVAGNGTFTSNLYENGNRVCTAANGFCGGLDGGFLNTSNQVILANNDTNVSLDADIFFIDTTNNRVGIGTIAPSMTLTINGTLNSTSIISPFMNSSNINSTNITASNITVANISVGGGTGMTEGDLFVRGHRYNDRWINRTLANYTLTGTTLVNMSNLSWTAVANRNYTFECSVYYLSNTTTNGISFALEDYGGTVSRLKFGATIQTVSTTTVNSGVVLAMGTKITSTAVQAVGTPYQAFLTGVIINGGSDVIIAPQFSAEVANLNSTVLQDSYCEVNELPPYSP